MNAIYLYRIARWLYEKRVPVLPKVVQAIIFFIYNSKITPDTKIGKNTYFVCKGISTVLIPGTEIGENCVLGLRFSTVRQFPYKDVPILGNNVWVGPNVIVAGPVILEDDVIVVGNSYVTKSVPKGAIVSGNPARIVGWRKDLKYQIETNPKFKTGKMPFLIERSLMSESICSQKQVGNGTLDRVKTVVAECLNLPKNSFTGNEKIEDIGEWDSLSNVLIIAQLEKEFVIKIPMEHYIKLVSLKAIADVVDACLSLKDKKTGFNIENAIISLSNIDSHVISHSPLLRTIIEKAQYDGTKAAVISANSEVSYAELICGIRRTASYLSALGLKIGDKIILAGNKEIEFLYVYFASHLLGLVNVIVDGNSNADRLNYIEQIISPKKCFGYKSMYQESVQYNDINVEKYEEFIIDKLDINGDAVSEILFTTGTTGKPKGVCLSYNNIFASANNINEFIQNNHSDIELIGLPICHSFGLGRIRCNLINGATVVFIPSFANVAHFFELIEKYKVTGFGVVPAAWAYITKMSGDSIKQYSDQIRYIEIGSAAMDLNTKKKMLQMFPKTRICMHYGSTEASRSTFIEFHDIDHIESIGKPVTKNVDIKIYGKEGQVLKDNECGEICIKGNMVMSHYLGEAQREGYFYDEYFRTGDYGYKSTDGYFYLLGREKEMINVGGKKVSPFEVEDIICSLGVGDCICIPYPDKSGLLGEVVKCYILRGSTTLSFKEIDEKLNNRLETYKKPVVYEWIDVIPKTESGKKQRIVLMNDKM